MPCMSSATIAGEQLDFVYQPLVDHVDSIRLLRIPRRTSKFEESVEYTLSHNTLQDAGDFVALSYCWGDHNIREPITINARRMFITESLATALTNLQSDESDTVLWADAVCINQQDAIEKTSQVQLMRDIYKRAKSVIIWLGPSTPETFYTIREIRKLGQELLDAGLWDLTAHQILHWDVDDDDESKAACTKRAVLQLKAKHLALALNDEIPFWWIMSDLNERKWFHRIWCIQECTNAKRAIFRCGKDEVEFPEVWATALYFRIFSSQPLDDPESDAARFWEFSWLTNLLSNAIPTTVIGIRRKYLVSDGFDLRTLLDRVIVKDSNSARIDASDPRDRVYALLGIANDAASQAIVADYTLSCEAAYTMTTRILLQDGHDDMLSHCRIRGSCENLPSWVPDWSADLRKPWSTWNVREQLFHASGTVNTESEMRRPLASDDMFATELKLPGVVVDTILEIGCGFSHGIIDKINWNDLQPFFANICQFLLKSNRYTSNQKEEAEWRIPVGDTEVSESSSQMRRASANSHMKRGYAAAKALANREAQETQLKEDLLPLACFQCQLERMYDSRPFISETGYVGLCPLETKPGDMIVIFLMARVPYIIRKAEHDTCWTLVGESHVYGIMDGEFMVSDPPPRDFTLK